MRTVRAQEIGRDEVADRILRIARVLEDVHEVTVPASRLSSGPPVIESFSGNPTTVVTNVIVPASSSTIGGDVCFCRPSGENSYRLAVVGSEYAPEHAACEERAVRTLPEDGRPMNRRPRRGLATSDPRCAQARTAGQLCDLVSASERRRACRRRTLPPRPHLGDRGFA